MKYLFRNGSTGFTEKEGEPLDSYRQPLRPWAIRSGRVVYSEWKTILDPPTATFKTTVGLHARRPQPAASTK